MTDATPPDLLTRLGAALAGQYRIERVLGQGGMGTVFLAVDLTLDRPVAIKVISPEVGTSPEIRQRFAQEAKTVARLRQPNIVAVYSAGEADGLLYFVMEYVPGESLRDRLTRERRLPVDDAVRILCDVALALDYAHGADVVHRDVKPENVLLDRESGRAMLTDFGVARAVAGDTRLTGVGFVLGSPRYMSPEQASGDASLDGRSDLYSLGLIGYEMLSGEPAVDAPTAASILVKQLTETPPSLSVKAPGTPNEVVTTIARLIEKAPEARFQRGAAVVAALAGEEFDERTPSHQIGRSSPGVRARGRVASRRPWIIAATAAVVSLAGAAVWFRTAKATSNDKAWLVAPFEVQGPDRSLDWLRDGSLNMLTLSLAQWNDLHVVEYERTLDLLRDAKLDAGQRVGLEDARGLARGVGAGRLVMGQVTALGDSLVVTASLFDVGTGTSTDRARIAAVKGSDPRPLFESIASQLLDLVGAPRITIELAKQTTSSVVAYRHYLDGLHALNAWRLRAADSSFDRAIQADSTFALAYYKKSVAMGWEASTDSVRFVAADRAVRLADRLPPRQQELVRGHADLTRAFQAMAEGDSAGVMSGFTSSRNRLAQLVATDSTDAEAWYSLADADYHLIWNSPYGRSPDSTAKYLSESLRGFKRTIALDSSFHLAYQHLVELYNQAATPRSFLVLVGDTIKPGGIEANERRLGSVSDVERLRANARQRARTAATGWIASDPDARAARRILADSYFDAGQGDSAIYVLREALKRPSTASAVFEFMIPLVKARTGMPSAGPELKSTMARYTTDSIAKLPFGERFQSLLGVMAVGAMTGMPSLIDDAAVKLAGSTPTMPGGGNTPTTYVTAWYANVMKSAMGVPLTPSARTQLVRAMEGFPVSQRDVGAPYLLYLGTRDTIFATTAKSWSPQPATAFPELSALVALQRGDTVTASRIAREFPPPDSIRKGLMSMNGARNVARAQVLADLGNVRLAVATLETIEPSRFTPRTVPEPAWPLYVRSFLLRGRLYEQLGERDKATAAFQQFLTMWADAEAPIQPQLREARESIARLKESTSIPVKAGIPGSR